MSDAFSDAMRGQFDAGQFRLADDAFADDFGSTVVGRVRRRRALANAAVGGSTLVAVGAIVVAAMYLPRASSSPASSPGCATWTPSPDPFPVVTVPPVASDGGYDVTLPDGAGVMHLDSAADVSDALDVTLPDGSTFTVPRDDDGGYVFKVPQLNLVAVAYFEFSGNLTVSIGGVDAVATFAPGIAPPRLVSTAAPEPIIDCGTTSDAAAVESPFVCGFHMDTTYREDQALSITGAGFKTVPEAAVMLRDPTLTVANPAVSNIDPLVPYVTAVNNEVPGVAAGSDGDPATSKVEATIGVSTGVAVVKVQDGVVVATNQGAAADPGVVNGQLIVGDDGVSALVLDKGYFQTCPDVTSTAYVTYYAVAGSQTLVRQQSNQPPIYVWQQLRGVGD